MVLAQCAKFSDHRSYDSSSDTAAKLFYVTLQDHMIKRSANFTEWNSSFLIHILLILKAMDIVLLDI